MAGVPQRSLVRYGTTRDFAPRLFSWAVLKSAKNCCFFQKNSKQLEVGDGMLDISVTNLHLHLQCLQLLEPCVLPDARPAYDAFTITQIPDLDVI